MDFKQNIILENDIVELRPLELDDVTRLKHFSVNEPELWAYSLISAAGIEQLKEYVNLALRARKNGDSYPFIAYDKRSGAYAGSTRFYDFQERHNTVQLGYTWYGKDFQGTGLNKNCKYLMLEYAFEKWGLDRVEFRADHKNKRSIAAMKSIGCIEEGVLRSNCNSPDGRRDSIVLSILKSEWESEVKQKLVNKIKNNYA